MVPLYRCLPCSKRSTRPTSERCNKMTRMEKALWRPEYVIAARRAAGHAPDREPIYSRSASVHRPRESTEWSFVLRSCRRTWARPTSSSQLCTVCRIVPEAVLDDLRSRHPMWRRICSRNEKPLITGGVEERGSRRFRSKVVFSRAGYAIVASRIWRHRHRHTEERHLRDAVAFLIGAWIPRTHERVFRSDLKDRW